MTRQRERLLARSVTVTHPDAGRHRPGDTVCVPRDLGAELPDPMPAGVDALT